MSGIGRDVILMTRAGKTCTNCPALWSNLAKGQADKRHLEAIDFVWFRLLPPTGNPSSNDPMQS